MAVIECGLCGEKLKNIILLSRHLYYHHNKFNKEEYYLNFLGVRTYCECCGENAPFVNLAQGFKRVCSKRCATTLSWAGAEERRKTLSERCTNNNFFVPGKTRKGKKNKNPYPRTPAVLARFEKCGNMGLVQET